MKTILEVKKVHKSYKQNEVLKGISFSIHSGDIVALIGVNGSGKSTLIELICGIKKYNEGSIQFQGQDILNKHQIKAVKEQIGYMPQTFSLFADLTVRENLEYLFAIYDLKNLSRIDEVLTICYLKEKEHMLAKNLSGGYRQLLSLAAAILHNPAFLILDEPTSAMDPLFRKQFWNIIHACNQSGTTILVTTHYMEEIFACKKLMILAQGKIIHKTTVENIFENGKFHSINEVLDHYILKEQDEE